MCTELAKVSGKCIGTTRRTTMELKLPPSFGFCANRWGMRCCCEPPPAAALRSLLLVGSSAAPLNLGKGAVPAAVLCKALPLIPPNKERLPDPEACMSGAALAGGWVAGLLGAAAST